MKRSGTHRIAAICLVAGVLTGCQPHYAFEIFNRSGEDLQIASNSVSQQWEMNQSLRVTSNPRSGDVDSAHLSWISVQGGRGLLLQVVTASDTLAYPLELRSDLTGYMLRNTGVREWHLQLESNWKLYIIPPDSQPPIESLPSQPPGFPIMPLENWSSLGPVHGLGLSDTDS